LIVTISVWLQLTVEAFKAVLSIFNPPKPKNISGQVALVTGGANGLGKAIACRLAQEGCTIAIADIAPEAEATAKELAEKYKVTVKAFKCDVSDFESVEQLRQDIEKSVGCVDILGKIVNCLIQ